MMRLRKIWAEGSFSVEPEKLVVETVSPQSSADGIVIRMHGVEVEFPSGTDTGMLAAFMKALSHA